MSPMSLIRIRTISYPRQERQDVRTRTISALAPAAALALPCGSRLGEIGGWVGRHERSQSKTLNRGAKRAARLEQERVAREAIRRAEADHREAEAEKIAPALLRQPVTARVAGVPEPITLRNAILAPAQWQDPTKAGTVIKSFRADSALWSLYRHSRHITAHHLQAGKQFLTDFQLAFGARPGKGQRQAATSDPDGPGAIDRQFAALDRHKRSCAALGTAEGIVCAVVLLDWGREKIARWLHVRDADATVLIAEAMDRLCDHFWPTADAPSRPATEALGTIQLPDAGNVPLIQHARWRQPVGRERAITIGG